MKNLISEITQYLVDHRTIKGFEYDRLQALIKTDFSDVQGYEWSLLLMWSGMCLYDFEIQYNVKIDQEDAPDFADWLEKKGLKPAGIKFTDSKE